MEMGKQGGRNAHLSGATQGPIRQSTITRESISKVFFSSTVSALLLNFIISSIFLKILCSLLLHFRAELKLTILFLMMFIIYLVNFCSVQQT